VLRGNLEAQRKQAEGQLKVWQTVAESLKEEEYTPPTPGGLDSRGFSHGAHERGGPGGRK
jgi:hypothetical protein